MNILQELELASAHLKGVRDTIKAKVSALPDNPKIRRLAPRNCFVVMFSDLGNDWTPAFHDWQRQYERINAEIDRRGLDGMAALLREIITVGWFRETTGAREKFTFAPQVRRYLSEISGIPIA